MKLDFIRGLTLGRSALLGAIAIHPVVLIGAFVIGCLQGSPGAVMHPNGSPGVGPGLGGGLGMVVFVVTMYAFTMGILAVGVTLIGSLLGVASFFVARATTWMRREGRSSDAQRVAANNLHASWRAPQNLIIGGLVGIFLAVAIGATAAIAELEILVLLALPLCLLCIAIARAACSSLREQRNLVSLCAVVVASIGVVASLISLFVAGLVAMVSGMP